MQFTDNNHLVGGYLDFELAVPCFVKTVIWIVMRSIYYDFMAKRLEPNRSIHNKPLSATDPQIRMDERHIRIRSCA